MPLFTYFAVVVPALVGLLYLADAELGPPPPMKLSRETILSLEKPKAHSVPILTVSESRWVAPDPNPADATAKAAPPSVEPPKNVAKIAIHPRKKIARAAPSPVQQSRNMYAAYQNFRTDVW